MKRRQLQLLFLTGIVLALMVPTTILSSVTFGEDAQFSGDLREHFVDPGDDSFKGVTSAEVQRTSATPPATTEAGADNFARSEDQEFAKHALTTVQVEPREVQSDGNETSTSSNRSVVGWRSESISHLESSPRTAPAALSIPSLSINADVRAVGVDSDGALVIPDQRNTVGWYEHGTAPGESGTAVIAGHLDDARGRAVFYDLGKIDIGDEIHVIMEGGAQMAFTVVDKRAYDADSLPGETLFARGGDPTLALITCAGEFDRTSGRYTETLVVYAQPVS